MMTENDVVNSVCKYLIAKNYKVEQSLNTHQKGVDIIAMNDKHRLYIEAKGQTSSKEGSARFGTEFKNDQLTPHVSRAVFAALAILNDKPGGPKSKAGIALPATPGHIFEIDKVKGPLKALGIKVFLVSDTAVEEYI